MDLFSQFSPSLCLCSQNEHFTQNISSVIPLSPPINYWNKIHSSISQFIWNRKRPHLKLTTTQRRNANGGLSLPNFRFYFWSFLLRLLFVCRDSNASPGVSWNKIAYDHGTCRRFFLPIYLINNVSYVSAQ